MGDSYREHLKRSRAGRSRGGSKGADQEAIARSRAIKAQAQRKERARTKKWLTDGPGNGSMQTLL